MGKKHYRKNWKRQGPKRKLHTKVLIVCEGKKTEPNYLRGLKNSLRLSGANVEIVGEGVTPTSIVLSAKKRCLKDAKKGDPFDKVFCVFDKDQHANYEEAMQTIERMVHERIYMAITSVPSFEYWLLLHHTYSESPSNSSEMLNHLKQYMPNYTKGRTDIFEQLQEKLEDAKQNATRSLDSAMKNETDNPSTQVHILVECLQKLKRP